MTDYYRFLLDLTMPLREPLTQLSYSLQAPFLLAFVLGLLGALSPCQLSTNLAACAYLSRDVGRSHHVARSALAYLGGKVLVYSLVGGTVLVIGLQLAQVSVPVVVFTRKALGPVLVLLGLLMLGLIRLSWPLLTRLTFDWQDRIERERAEHDGRGAFVLGVAFSFAACPTLFVLFFGTLLPAAAVAAGIGLSYPAIFALGTSLPLLLFVAALALGAESIAPLVKQLRGANAWVSRLAALVFILVGLNEIALYWLA